MIEQERGCGFRKAGGLYIRGTGLAVPCDRLPYVLEYCPVCGSGIKFQRGYQMIHWYKYAGIHEKCKCDDHCPICHPKDTYRYHVDFSTDEDRPELYAIMWVGDKYYSPGDFIDEAHKQGICKRISAVPKDIVFGETWILLAHKKAGEKKNDDGEIEPCEAIFYAFRPTHVEKILTKKQARDKKLIKKLRKQNIKILIATEIDKDDNVRQTEPLPDDKECLGLLESL